MGLSPRALSSTEAGQLLGWWQLLSCEVEFQSSGDRQPMYDAAPRGYIVFSPQGRMMTVISGRHRGSSAVNREHAAASDGMAYAGRYRLEGARWLTEVDVASIVEWTGTIQERSFRIESGQLHVRSDWCVSALHGGQTVRAWLIWERLG